MHLPHKKNYVHPHINKLKETTSHGVSNMASALKKDKNVAHETRSLEIHQSTLISVDVNGS